MRGLFSTDSLHVLNSMFFIVFKKKKDDEYRLFTNQIFDDEKKAEYFGKTSMKRGFEHKVLEYNRENLDKYWNG